MPKKPEEKEVRRYLLLNGEHIEVERDEEDKEVGRKVYNAESNNIVDSTRDLITLFGANRFQLISDDITEHKTGPALGEGEDAEEFTRLDSKEKAQAGKDSVNKVTEEQAEKFRPGAKAHAYREDHGVEQGPPEEEKHDDEDERKKDLGLPTKRTSAERTSSKPSKPKEEKSE